MPVRASLVVEAALDTREGPLDLAETSHESKKPKVDPLETMVDRSEPSQSCSAVIPNPIATSATSIERAFDTMAASRDLLATMGDPIETMKDSREPIACPFEAIVSSSKPSRNPSKLPVDLFELPLDPAEVIFGPLEQPS